MPKPKPNTNRVRCLRCKDIITSSHHYDFVTCRCGAVSVDGGDDYHRRVGSQQDYEELPQAPNDPKPG